MAEETWTILLKEEGGGSSGGGGGSDAGGGGMGQEEETTNKRNQGNLVAQIVGSAGIIATVFQMIQRSKVFSAFTDAFLTIFAAIIDILLMPLVPVLMPFLKLAMSFLPVAFRISEWLTPIMQRLGDALDLLFETGDFSGIIEWVRVFLEEDMPPLIDMFFKDILPKILEFMTKILPLIVNFLVTVIPMIVDFLVKLLDVMIPAMEPVFTAVIDGFKRIWVLIEPVLTKFWNEKVWPEVAKVLNSIIEWVNANVLPEVNKFIATLWIELDPLLQGLVVAINAIGQSAVTIANALDWNLDPSKDANWKMLSVDKTKPPQLGDIPTFKVEMTINKGNPVFMDSTNSNLSINAVDLPGWG